MPDRVSPWAVWRTVRHLRRRQLLAQLRARLRRLLERPGRFSAGDPPPCPASRPFAHPPIAPGAQRNRAYELLAGRFRFLNRIEQLGWPPRWDPDGVPALWSYNLHYFEWLWALDFDRARAGTLDWIARYTPARGRVGWDPYPVSLRLQNWIAWFWGRHPERTLRDDELRQALWRSIHLQTEWLRGRLELHLLGNHLFENAAALVLVGGCFEHALARRWLRQGLELLASELDEQVPPDGLHFERSPMYHLRVLSVLLLLRAADGPGVAARVTPALVRMLAALERVVHPDGGIALLNDAAFGICNEPAELLALGGSLLGETAIPRPAPDGPWTLPDAGYYGFRRDGDYVICDAGAVGPDYIPGHAHGDLFSFELSLRGRRVIVDSGVHDYEAGPLRDYCRSTRAHNTVELDGRDQCEFWGVFRVGRRCVPRDVVWEPAPDGFRLRGRHDGYRRLPGRPRHERDFRLHPSGVLEIEDRVVGRRPLRAKSRLHLHPDCTVAELSARHAVVVYPAGRFVVRFRGAGALTREPSTYCPEFGLRRDASALVFTSQGRRIETAFRIEP